MAETTGQGPKRVERPLSPFMLGPYYRIQMTSVVSILTRITGNALIVGGHAGGLVAGGAATVGCRLSRWRMRSCNSWFGDLVFTLSLLALWYHYLAGPAASVVGRGRGLDIKTAERLGWACMIGSVGADHPYPDPDLRRRAMRYLTDRKRAVGRGAGHTGTEHHWSMTVSAVALAFLVPVWVYVFGHALGGTRDEVVATFARPFPGDPDRADAGGGDAAFRQGRTDDDRGLRPRFRAQGGGDVRLARWPG